MEISKKSFSLFLFLLFIHSHSLSLSLSLSLFLSLSSQYLDIMSRAFEMPRISFSCSRKIH